jgi:sulfate/thiosulfate transport system substrate-binding protein
MQAVKRFTLVGLLLALGVLGLSACGGSSSSDTVNLVAYSTPQEVYENSIIPGFGGSSDGKGVDVKASFGASGDQARKVQSGNPADVVALSLAPDVEKLVEDGKVAKDWQKASKYDGFVTNSVVVFMVRKGNPKNIKTWADLTKSGVDVVTPNPFTSGGARWNIMAAYGAQLEQGKSPEQAREYLKQLFANVSVQDKSARESLQTFQNGTGDVLLGYENEAITAQGKGEELDFVVPPETILIENPIAVTETATNKEKGQAFIQYAQSTPAQKAFAAAGYRPVDPAAKDPAKFPEPAQLFEIDRVGGWSEVNDEFFDPEKGFLVEIEQEKGVETG